MMPSLTWHRLPACVSAVMTGWVPIPLLLLVLLGCTTDTAPKASHFEHDHSIAMHWPSDLADAASKIRDRLAWLEDGRVPKSHGHDHGHSHSHSHGHSHDHGHHKDHEIDPRAEIVEIVSWIPEIAADTNLAEADWLPLYHATESLSANLRSSDGEWTDDNRQQIESLCELVDQAASEVPELLPSLMGGPL